MADGVELSNLVNSPVLERIVREERLGRDHPRKPRDQGTKPAKENGPEDDNASDASVSSQHIDLRI